jgi:hypothetical protein
MYYTRYVGLISLIVWLGGLRRAMSQGILLWSMSSVMLGFQRLFDPQLQNTWLARCLLQ